MTGRCEHEDALRKPALELVAPGKGIVAGDESTGMTGNSSIDRWFQVTRATRREVFYHLGQQRELQEGMRPKSNMALSGSSAPNRTGAVEVAEKTVAREPETAVA